MDKDSRYVIVTEDEDITGPFPSEEDAQRYAETLRDPVTGNLPRITDEFEYVKFAESDERCKAYMKGQKNGADTTGSNNTFGLIGGKGAANPKGYSITKIDNHSYINLTKKVTSKEEYKQIVGAAVREVLEEKNIPN
jgi:hypothetical protein